MKCRNCDKEFSDENKSCPNCGESVDNRRRDRDDNGDEDEGEGILGTITSFIGNLFK